MPPLILLAIAGAGVYAGYKYLVRHSQQASPPSRDDARQSGVKNLGELEWDAKAGVYRPKSGS